MVRKLSEFLGQINRLVIGHTRLLDAGAKLRVLHEERSAIVRCDSRFGAGGGALQHTAMIACQRS
jgi:hypothetical protein